ncbi:hypothetical protein [Glycomyces sp. NPDC048151]|uniref:hypothetical protein n=1 Tax=Glycomyces sp. NPDC048151 TaxID=3364002 RepID=UPI00371FD15E
MDTIDNINNPAPALIPLGTIRRAAHTMLISIDPSRFPARGFTLASGTGGTGPELGVITFPEDGDFHAEWTEAAKEIGIGPDHPIERGIVNTCRDLAAAVWDQELMPGEHDFRPVANCAYAIAVNDRRLTWLS